MSKEREVSGKIISTDDACNWNLTVGALKDYDHVYVNGVRYVEFQPEQTEQEPVATKLESHQFTAFHVSALDFKKLQKLPIGTKLYTAPPKREPLSDDEIESIWEQDSLGTTVEFVRAIEKAHGIGGGE